MMMNLAMVKKTFTYYLHYIMCNHANPNKLSLFNMFHSEFIHTENIISQRKYYYVLLYYGFKSTPNSLTTREIVHLLHFVH